MVKCTLTLLPSLLPLYEHVLLYLLMMIHPDQHFATMMPYCSSSFSLSWLLVSSSCLVLLFCGARRWEGWLVVSLVKLKYVTRGCQINGKNNRQRRTTTTKYDRIPHTTIKPFSSLTLQRRKHPFLRISI